MNPLVILARSAILATGLAFTTAASAQNLLSNPDFAGNLDNWGTFGAVGVENFFGQNFEAAFYSNTTGNSGGIFQNVSGTAGMEYTFTIRAMRIETNTNPTISYGLEFRDSNGILSVASTSIDYGSVVRNDNGFSPASVVGVAPIGTTTVRPIIRYEGTVAPSDFFYVFDTELTAVPEPASFATLAGLGAIGCAALRRRRRA